MKYKKLTDGRQRSYKSLGNWGIGATIQETRSGVVLMMDIAYEDQILPFVNLRFESVPLAKLHAAKTVRNISNEFGKCTEES